jgi:hypothetical protein
MTATHGCQIGISQTEPIHSSRPFAALGASGKGGRVDAPNLPSFVLHALAASLYD